MLAGVEFSRCAIQTSVMPCATQSRISDRYGLRVALVVVTAGSLTRAAGVAQMQQLDHRLVAWMSGLDLPLVTPVMKLASAVGADGFVFVGIAFWVALSRRRIAPAAVVVVAVRVVADPVQRPEGAHRSPPSQPHLRRRPSADRPADQLVDAERPCLDRVRLCDGAVGGAAAPAGWLFALATLIAVSRVYLGVHYPSDVLVGAAGGVATGLLVLLGARLVHVHVGPDDDRDRGDQRQRRCPRRADRDADGRGGAEVAAAWKRSEQHQ